MKWKLIASRIKTKQKTKRNKNSKKKTCTIEQRSPTALAGALLSARSRCCNVVTVANTGYAHNVIIASQFSCNKSSETTNKLTANNATSIAGKWQISFFSCTSMKFAQTFYTKNSTRCRHVEPLEHARANAWFTYSTVNANDQMFELTFDRCEEVTQRLWTARSELYQNQTIETNVFLLSNSSKCTALHTVARQIEMTQQQRRAIVRCRTKR